MLVHLLEPFWQQAYAHKMDRERAVHKSINYTKTYSVEQGPWQAASHSTSQKTVFHITGIFISFAYNSP